MASKKKSKKGDAGPTPVELSESGIPVGENSLKLIYAMRSVITHCDIFSPCETWIQHKEKKRVEKLWNDLKEPWGLPERASTKKWFNLRANRMWTNHKSKVLKPFYLAAQGDFEKAIANRPTTLIGVESWSKLCKQFQKTDDAGDDANGKSKSQKCKEARQCNQMDHSLGRTSLEYWSHKHYQLFGKYPTVVEFYRKAYLHVDPTQSSESTDASSQSEQSEVSEQPIGVSRNPETWRILGELNKAYDEALANGDEVEEAKKVALLKVLGESTRLYKVIQPKATKESSKRKRLSNEENVEIDSLKEKLEQEKIERQKLEDKLKLIEEKREKTDEQLQRLISHFGLNALPPSTSENGEPCEHRTIVSEPSVEGIPR